MLSPAACIWHAAGSPLFPISQPGTCRTCGMTGEGQPFNAWVRDTFTDHGRLFPGEIVCHACLFCFDEASVALQERTGKAKPQRMRNYSHFVVNSIWHPLSKGDKTRMRQLLFQEPTVAVIAESGQKHLIFKARAGWWLFEEQLLQPCPDLLISLFVPIEALYNAGASKQEIETGHYGQRTLLKVGFSVWREYEPQIQPHRGSLPLKLAVFLAQKEKDSQHDT